MLIDLPAHPTAEVEIATALAGLAMTVVIWWPVFLLWPGNDPRRRERRPRRSGAQRQNASPGGKLSWKSPEAIFMTEEECGRQRWMTENPKTYSGAAYPTWE